MAISDQLDLAAYILRPSVAEIQETRVLYFSRYGTLSEAEMIALNEYPATYQVALRQTFRHIGLNFVAESDPSILFGPLDYDYIYGIQLYGSFEGKELLVPAIAGFHGIPFLGAPAPVRALSEDKTLAKSLAASVGVDVARHLVVNPLAPATADLFMPGRWVLKPRNGVMSRDTILIEGEKSWRAALTDAAHPRHEGRDFMVEEFAPGLNLTVPVIEGLPLQSLAVFEEHGPPGHNILSQAGKDGQTGDYAAEPYDGPGAAEASAAAARLAAAISPFDYARFDFRYDPESRRLVFLEFNIACMMGPASVVARAAAMGGVDYPSLVGHVFTRSLRRQRMQL